MKSALKVIQDLQKKKEALINVSLNSLRSEKSQEKLTKGHLKFTTAKEKKTKETLVNVSFY